jgi:uncharacterized protein (TIGR01777 family)
MPGRIVCDVHIVLAGSTGLIGTALVARLRADGHTVVRLVRSEPTGSDVLWDAANGQLDAGVLEPADAVINLAGAGIGDHRWTEEYRRTLVESRTRTTSLLAERLAEVGGEGRVLLSGSAIGAYGDRGDEELTEASARGTGFLADLVRDWEASTATAEAAGTRVVHLRTGIVLAKQGGALAKMLPLFRVGLGGRFGDGRQWMSWISLPDQVGAIVHLLTSDDRGSVNLTAPNPVRNAEFAKALGATLKRPSVIPVPRFAPRLALGRDQADALLFESQRVVGTKLIDGGYRWSSATISEALAAVT